MGNARLHLRLVCQILGAAFCALAASAAPSSAYFDVECRLITNEKPLIDESGLSADDKLALAALRTLVASDALMSRPPTVVYNFSSLFIGINPTPSTDEPFGRRTLVAATRINGVTTTAWHKVTSPRYYFSTSVNSQITTRLVFFGDTHLDILLSGPFSPGPSNSDRIMIDTITTSPDLEKLLCDKPAESAPAK